METFVSLVSLKNNRQATFLYSMSDKTSAIVIIIKVDKITMAKKTMAKDKATKGQKDKRMTTKSRNSIFGSLNALLESASNLRGEKTQFIQQKTITESRLWSKKLT